MVMADESAGREAVEVGISLGSNVDPRLEHMIWARARIALIEGVSLEASSQVFETLPQHVAPEHEHLLFLNAVVIVRTSLRMECLLWKLQEIERQRGRLPAWERGFNEPRTIDLDILYAGSLRMNETYLTIPHPRMGDREFLLRPLAELRPDFTPPGWFESVGKRYQRFAGKQGVELYEHQKEWLGS
ncbi:MAG: 2-amino-4-hydroxy-6-hydroxymethyldihydropteridine diphosphokinase [Verrucomicrobiota bacterium]|jgi:2-amino-4-hydroxy-6-hydroxymethyldihydropteridine diphosphokinase|nr:2-amino-4-hydroxy-6-hydroxymethyldihydropteridine diphosphokinase [Verrucomicrobiota bacterium]HCF95963.1 2-amino-4-hydroxy-6-hydroxymethyldihydropteridine diphosphokinase [Verrucomicrobiota bacterium]